MPLPFSYLQAGPQLRARPDNKLSRRVQLDIPSPVDLCMAWASHRAYVVRPLGPRVMHRFPDFVERYTQLLDCSTSQDGLQWQFWRVWDIGFVLSFAGTRPGANMECVDDLRTSFDTQATDFHGAYKHSQKLAAGFHVHRGALKRLQSLLPGLSSRIRTAMDRSLKQYPMDKTVLYPAYHTASLTGLLAPLYCTGHSLGGQIAILASLHLLQNARHLSCSAGGCWTYGAPLVVLDKDPDARVAALQHAAQHSWRDVRFVNFVSQHDKFAGWLGNRSYFSSLKGYRPLGDFCVLKKHEDVWRTTYVTAGQVEAVIAAQANNRPFWKTGSNVTNDHRITTYVAALQACLVRVL